MSSQTVGIASEFILDAPPGELQDVLADIKALVSEDASVIDGLTPAIEKYNKEQLLAAKLPGGSGKVIISQYNSLGDGRFFDVGNQSSFAFDHVTQKASDVRSYSLESQNSHLIQSLLQAVGPHVSEHYPSEPAYGVFPVDDDSAVAILVVGNKYSPGNYWNGRWRSTYIYTPSTKELAGTIAVDVHYYEDGNVRLVTSKTVSESLNGGTAVDIVKIIGLTERKYQEEVNKAFTTLNEGAFKNLRRQLPITRQKIDWDKIGSYRLGQDIGGGRAEGR